VSTPPGAGSAPTPKLNPQEPPPVLRAGWWRDPFRIGRTEQRYHDGAQWTRFTSVKTNGVWSGVVERTPSYYRGRINGEERPEARYLPEPKSVALDPPHPPSVGWWMDPFRSGGEVQRYYDGRAWTKYTSTKRLAGWDDIIETPAEPPPPGAAAPGLLRRLRNDPMGAGVVLFLVGCLTLVVSSAFDRHGRPFHWFSRLGFLTVIVGLVIFAVGNYPSAADPEPSDDGAWRWIPFAIAIAVLAGMTIVGWHELATAIGLG
jgi:hypothetical protein